MSPTWSIRHILRDYSTDLNLLVPTYLACVRRSATEACFPYNRPNRPDRLSRLKICSGDRSNYMKINVVRPQTIKHPFELF